MAATSATFLGLSRPRTESFQELVAWRHLPYVPHHGLTAVSGGLGRGVGGTTGGT